MGVPDGATAEHGGNDQEPAATNTAATTDAPVDGEQDPGTPADQVNAEIAYAEVSEWWKSLFGSGGDPHEAGGGGTGGQFMFANIEELDGVITKWKGERDGILADKETIAQAYGMIAEPAGDTMSAVQATASRNSLAIMWEHSDQMLKYAENYILKLQASRDGMATTETGVRDTFKSMEA